MIKKRKIMYSNCNEKIIVSFDQLKRILEILSETPCGYPYSEVGQVIYNENEEFNNFLNKNKLTNTI